MHTSSPDSPQSPGPKPWQTSQAYTPGQVVYWNEKQWRCEQEHTSGVDATAAPSVSSALWADQSDTTSPPHAGPSTAATAPPPILSPLPLAMPARPPPPTLRPDENPFVDDSDDAMSSSSKGASIGGGAPGNGRYANWNPWDASMFIDRAAESMRYLAMQQETTAAQDPSSWREELQGSRIWKTGGVGIWTHSLDPAEEVSKRETWEGWVAEQGTNAPAEWKKLAKARTDFYNSETKGPKPLITWKLFDPDHGLPHDAIPIGRENGGEVLYAARSFLENGVHVGKASPYIVNGVAISYGGDEHNPDHFEILCGPTDPTLLKWMTFRHGEKAEIEGWQPVEGGREADGRALLIAKGEFEDGEHPGKCLIGDDHACMGWNGGEVWIRPFQILAYNARDRR